MSFEPTTVRLCTALHNGLLQINYFKKMFFTDQSNAESQSAQQVTLETKEQTQNVRPSQSQRKP